MIRIVRWSIWTNHQATRRENADACADEERTTGTGQLPIRAQWHGQSVHDVCTARRVAAREGDRAPRIYPQQYVSPLCRTQTPHMRSREHKTSGPDDPGNRFLYKALGLISRSKL